MPSAERLQQAQPDELRSMVTGLLTSLQQARTDAAHYKLQHRMLAIESAEAVERIQVEMNMAQREIEVLNTSDFVEPRVIRVPQPSDPGMRHVHVDMWNSMLHETQRLQSQNAQLEQSLSQHKRMVVQQESEIATLNDRISLLRERLRENRSHLTRYRRAAGFLDSPRRSSSAHSTPWSAHSRPQPPFAALLHASDLMSERATMSPRTPRRKRASSTTPTTPQTLQPALPRNMYETPQSLQSMRHLQVPQTAPPLRGPLFHSTMTGHQSTASDALLLATAEDSEAETEVPEQSKDLVEDQASLVEAPQTPVRGQKASSTYRPNAVQKKLFDQVKKAGVQRDEHDASTKSSSVEHAHVSRVDRTET